MTKHIETSRRNFLKLAATAAAAAPFALGCSAVAKTPNRQKGLVDVNVNLGRWPFRRLPQDDPASLVAKLRSRGVTQAWTGSLDALLHKDVGFANERLVELCHRHGRGLLVPFGSVNPRLPGWEHDLELCAEVYRMPGIRLHPNYHGYQLDDPQFVDLLQMARDRRLIVQMAVLMEDERAMHPLVRVEPVDTKPLATVLRNLPGLPLLLLNATGKLRGESLRKLLSTGNLYFEIAALEGVGGIGNLIGEAPVEKILFGSHAPLFYFEAAELKLQESSLSSEQRDAIRWRNAQQLLAGCRRNLCLPRHAC